MLREKLEGVLEVYRNLIDVTTGERQAIAEEMMQINQAKMLQRYIISSGKMRTTLEKAP